MRHSWLLIPIVIFLIGCSKTDFLIGKWERMEDEASGTIVEVKKMGDTYQGKLIKPAGILNELGFAEGDVKWRDIRVISENKWEGKDLEKEVDTTGAITSADYKEVRFTFFSDGTLEVRRFAKEEEIIGTVQRWRKIE